ncbi:MAG: hypothetical protein JO321_17805 [Solirubrobacterales bacterium]|nr:hypothetical protein [Solirubrobacterales bacterium]MBV9537258.1 hypothetical protein [Solirubrobacterales bacterium]
MRFTDFLRTTVLISAGAASLLAAVTVAGAVSNQEDGVVAVAAGWWLMAAAFGMWSGRRRETTESISNLLAGARMPTTLPEVRPWRTVLNRLWPLFFCTLGAVALAFLLPQVPGVATGFAIIWALAWRRQGSAVAAIEERDGARFYIDKTSPIKPMKLVRTPGFRSNLLELNGASRSSRQTQPRL